MKLIFRKAEDLRRRRLRDGKRWGNWTLVLDNYTLIHTPTNSEVDLDKMSGSAPMLDWIFQMAEKRWCSDQELGQFVRALDQVFSPQKNVCSGGRNKRFNAPDFLRGKYKKIETGPKSEV